jgi:pimeloyl-ACP methyl ester carboxylesterase
MRSRTFPPSYVGKPGKQFMHDQMYVEVLTPRHPRQRYPLMLIHGAAQTATNWMGTPDGRPGWADYFVAQGYTIYMVDQPARGRSPWLPDVDGKLATFAAEQIESRFTAPQVFNLWPQAKLHSQWPGPGRIGDPVFDAFYATQLPDPPSSPCPAPGQRGVMLLFDDSNSSDRRRIIYTND